MVSIQSHNTGIIHNYKTALKQNSHRIAQKDLSDSVRFSSNQQLGKTGLSFAIISGILLGVGSVAYLENKRGQTQSPKENQTTTQVQTIKPKSDVSKQAITNKEALGIIDLMFDETDKETLRYLSKLSERVWNVTAEQTTLDNVEERKAAYKEFVQQRWEKDNRHLSSPVSDIVMAYWRKSRHTNERLTKQIDYMTSIIDSKRN